MDGGLGQNRTADTRIFNTRGAQIVNIYAAYKRFSCNVLYVVLHKKHSFLPVFRNTFSKLRLN